MNDVEMIHSMVYYRYRSSLFKSHVLRRCCILKGEGGSIMVIALMILALLTVIGLSASRITETEIQIARNENMFKQNLYLAESAAMAGAQMLENETDITVLENLSLNWLHSSLPDTDIRSDTNWNPSNNNSNQVLDATTRYLAVYQGIAPGSSLDIGGPQTSLHQFVIYGCSTKNHGEALIEVGYRRRF